MGFIRTPLVSLQVLAPGDAVKRHVVWGVLVGPDAVVVPVPDDGLGDGVEQWYEVLLASPAGRSYAIERIAVDRIEVNRVAGFTGAVATVQLGQASRHATFAGPFEPAVLAAFAAAATVPTHVWTALAAVGFVPADVLDRPRERLEGVAAVETERARGRVVEREFRSVLSASNVFCCNWFVHKCCRKAGRPLEPDEVPGNGPVLLDGPVLRLP